MGASKNYLQVWNDELYRELVERFKGQVQGGIRKNIDKSTLNLNRYIWTNGKPMFFISLLRLSSNIQFRERHENYRN